MENKRVPEVRFAEFSGEWELLTLGDIANKFEYGLNASATNYDGKNRYIRITDIDDHSRNLINSNLTSPNTNLSASQNYLLNQGDILIARTGASVGKSYIYNSSDGIAYFAGFLIRMRLLNNYHPYFIFQHTLTEKYRTYINITSQRSGQPGVNAKEYASFSLRVPILDEQIQIGNFFKQLDETIALQQQELDTLKQTKQGFLQKMFPKEGEAVPEVRFPGFSGEWESRNLGSIAEFINGRAYKQKELLSDGKYKVVRVGNFYTNKSWYYSNLDLDDKYYANNGDLLYTWSASFGPHIWSGDKVIYHYHIWKINLSNSFLKHFALQLLEYDKQKLLSDKNGSTMVHVTKKGMEDKKVTIPNIQEQTQIGNFFKQLDDTIALHEKELETLKETKKAFLQKMFV
ncbi:restriction endonuclease subunit S [Geomicrobium sp. JSM 1781026]|uniref:restriction endonuclease subunit S n=1 Tax=Geomicrobium sp. JSM 1781026 TaxID=3344580 RepID=UPI0035BEBB70